MHAQVLQTIAILWLLTKVVVAGSPTRRQADTSSRTIDLKGPQITYEGPWEDVTSPCNLGSIARRSDNSLAQDVKAIITFADDVKAFSLSMQANSEVVSYTVAHEGVRNRYDAKNNPSTPPGQSGCPVLLTHEFTGMSSKNVTITLQLPRGAKRDKLAKRQTFELPWIQINEVKAFLSTEGLSPTGTQTAETTPSTTSTPGAAMSNVAVKRSLLGPIGAVALGLLLA